MYLAQLDVEKPPVLLGDEYTALRDEILAYMQRYSFPIDLVGPPGSGKSMLGTAIAIEYARRTGVPARSIVHDEDTTKSSVIAGFRIVKGNTVVVPAAVALSMTDGAVLLVDEFTHTSGVGMQTPYNTVSDRTHHTSAGDQTYRAKQSFRLIVAHNNEMYAGNQSLAPSTGSRFRTWEIPYPSALTECKIAKAIVVKEREANGCHEPFEVPDSVLRYLIWLMRDIRKEYTYLGLSARNVALALASLDVLAVPTDTTTIDRHFVPDSVKQLVAERVLHKEPGQVNTNEYKSKSVVTTMAYLTACGLEKFRDIVMGSYMAYLDIKGGTVKGGQRMREAIKNKIV